MTDIPSLPVLLDALEKTARGIARDDVPALVGDLERVKTIAWARLAAPHPQEPAAQDALLTAEDVSGQTQLSAAWQRDGLKAPDPVRKATEGYRAEMDVLGTFITDVCVEEPRGEVTAADLYAAYTTWSDENGERPVPQREFGLRLTERGFGTKAKRNGTWRLGISLRDAGVNLVKDREPISGVLSQIPPHEEEHRKSLHQGSQGSPTTPCRICGQTTYHRAGDGYACSMCHPPPTTRIPFRTGIGRAGSGRQ